MKPLAPWLFVFAASVMLAQPATKNVIVVTIDGLRWQEVFSGMDETILDKERGGVNENTAAELRRAYAAATPEARRQKLMPFVWSTVAAQGQLFGNRALRSPVRVVNGSWASYAGYNELLTGRPDPRIVSNGFGPNPNVTVLEWLQGRPGFAGKVGAAAAWDVFRAILNVERSRLPLFVTLQQSAPGSVSPRIAEIERWMQDLPPITPRESYDAFAYEAGLDMIARQQPRVFLLALGEPDEWAHARRYERYLDSIRRCDRFIRQLWEFLQARPEYRDSTTLLITPDHGRGAQATDWAGHGRKTPQSEETWLMALGPDTRALGERRDTVEVHQAQVAATVAALLGEDFVAAFPGAAGPVQDFLPASAQPAGSPARAP